MILVRAAFLVLLAGLSGCFGGRKLPAVWSPNASHVTAHYYVLTDADAIMAREVGVLMESAYAAYCRLTAVPPESPARFRINLYAADENYVAAAANEELPSPSEAAFFSPVPPATIHALCSEDLAPPPSDVLVREGFRQFADHFLLFHPSVDEQQTGAISSIDALTVLPPWLNEGLAAYIEAAADGGNQITFGLLHRKHLACLQELIRSGHVPKIETVLSRTYGEPFDAAAYAVSWGIVHVLMQEKTSQAGETSTRKLQNYIKAAQRGFYIKPKDGFQQDFSLYASSEVFQRSWNRRLGAKSLNAFKALVVGSDRTLELWEAEWHETILRIE